MGHPWLQTNSMCRALCSKTAAAVEVREYAIWRFMFCEGCLGKIAAPVHRSTMVLLNNENRNGSESDCKRSSATCLCPKTRFNPYIRTPKLPPPPAGENSRCLREMPGQNADGMAPGAFWRLHLEGAKDASPTERTSTTQFG